MNKKVAFAIGAVLAFFATAILVDLVPSVATLGCFIAAAAGFTCGYFFKKAQGEESFALYESELDSLEAELENLKTTKLETPTNNIKKGARK